MCQATVAISEIRVDGETQCRGTLDESVIAEYADNLDALPPAVIFNDGTDCWLADGFYRRAAHIHAGRDRMVCVIKTGTLDDARWYAAGANRTHGVRRSQADKEKAVRLALSLKAKRSDSDVAAHCGVSPSTVARHRADMKAESVPWDDDSEVTPSPPKPPSFHDSHFSLLKSDSDQEEPQESQVSIAEEDTRIGADNRVQTVSSKKRSKAAKQRHADERDELLSGLHPDVVAALADKKIKPRQAKALAKVPHLLQKARLEEILNPPPNGQTITGHLSAGAEKPPANEKPSGDWAVVQKIIGKLSRAVDSTAESCGLATNGTAIKAVHSKINEVKQLIDKLPKPA